MCSTTPAISHMADCNPKTTANEAERTSDSFKTQNDTFFSEISSESVKNAYLGQLTAGNLVTVNSANDTFVSATFATANLAMVTVDFATINFALVVVDFANIILTLVTVDKMSIVMNMVDAASLTIINAESTANMMLNNIFSYNFINLLLTDNLFADFTIKDLSTLTKNDNYMRFLSWLIYSFLHFELTVSIESHNVLTVARPTVY